MTDPTRGTGTRRGGRRPGWLLLTVLLVLAIMASSALVFTNRVELLKLAVILALWAAVVAAFVSVIYRRQSDLDQARARDLKLVYDLQLDREISARREYELTVETQLRRELASELRAQAADEVASLRAELAVLRTNLEILFDTDPGNRSAIETDRTTVRAYSDWARDNETAGRVSSSRIDAEVAEDDEDVRIEECPIIDVPAEPQPADSHWAYGGVHRRPSEAERGPEEQRRRRHTEAENGSAAEYVGRRRATETAPAEPVLARHSAPPDAVDPARPAEPTLATEAGQPSQHPEPEPEPAEESAAADHQSAEEAEEDTEEADGQHTGGHSVAELLARLQATPSGGGRRRRREA